MPQVTRLIQQKRHPDRYSIYLDGAFAFGLSSLDLSNSGLREGQLLSVEDIDNWIRLSEEGSWYNRVVGLISYRRRSRREITDYLHRKDVEDELITKLLDRLEGIGLLDDRAFAAAWIADRRLLRPRSNRHHQRFIIGTGVGLRTRSASTPY
jgi:regulatory protein